MATANKTMSATKVVIPCRISFANIFEPKSINGSEAKYSVSCLIPKTDKKILLAIHKAIEAAKEDGKTRKWSGKIPPNLKMPLRDGDIDRPDDENYQEHFFLNATSKDAPQVVDRHVQPKRGYTRQWQKISRQYLQAHPLCAECMRQGRYTKATVVDHITPHRGDPRLFWDEANWQPMCKQCHDRKTLTEDIHPVYRY